MIEIFGVPLGTPFQGLTLAAVIVIGIGLAVRAWIVGMPDRTRAKTEGRAHDDADDEKRRREAREEIHREKNERAKVAAALAACHKVATAATAQLEQMMFLFELMLSEQEDIHPDSKIVQRARVMFNRISTDLKDPSKSDALHTAELAVEDAKQTLSSTKDTCAEVKRSEGGDAPAE